MLLNHHVHMLQPQRIQWTAAQSSCFLGWQQHDGARKWKWSLSASLEIREFEIKDKNKDKRAISIHGESAAESEDEERGQDDDDRDRKRRDEGKDEGVCLCMCETERDSVLWLKAVQRELLLGRGWRSQGNILSTEPSGAAGEQSSLLSGKNPPIPILVVVFSLVTEAIPAVLQRFSFCKPQARDAVCITSKAHDARHELKRTWQYDAVYCEILSVCTVVWYLWVY